MTLDEAKTIAEIIGGADDGCADCVGDLIGALNMAFPAFKWSMTGQKVETVYCGLLAQEVIVERA